MLIKVVTNSKDYRYELKCLIQLRGSLHNNSFFNSLCSIGKEFNHKAVIHITLEEAGNVISYGSAQSLIMLLSQKAVNVSSTGLMFISLQHLIPN